MNKTNFEELDSIVSGLTSRLEQPVERIDTHGAVVLLSGDKAIKLKKPVHFSFFDFRTIEHRRTTLLHELKLNQRTAPAIYHEVLPIVRDQDGFSLGGSGKVVEWALVMTRFNREDEFDRLAARGSLSRAMMLDLADRISVFHQGLDPIVDLDAAAAMGEVVRGNEEDLLASVPAIFDKADVERVITSTAEMFEQVLPALGRRARQGFVRHCHGDIHLANIVMIDDQPVLFDCIEFNDDFARIDLLYDIAFLLMDLIERGMPDHAQAFFQRYYEAMPYECGMGTMPFFISLRAAIRAKVTAFGGERDVARAYLSLAQHALHRRTPRLVAIGGRSGTGKSTLAKSLAPQLGCLPGAVILRSDVIRKRLWGQPAETRLPVEAYDLDVTKQVFAEIAQRADRLIDEGMSVIADGVFGEPWQRSAIEDVAMRHAVQFDGIWLHGHENLLVQRVQGRQNDASDAGPDIVRAQAHLDQVETSWRQIDAERGIDMLKNEVLSSMAG